MDEMTVKPLQQNLYVADTYYIADIIFGSQFTVTPWTDLSVVDSSNNRPYKTFLVRNLYIFYFRQSFTVSFTFSPILITFLASLMA